MYDVTHNIEDSKKGKAKYSNELSVIYFSYSCALKCFGEKKKKGEEPTTLNRGIIKNLCAFERHEDLHACM